MRGRMVTGKIDRLFYRAWRWRATVNQEWAAQASKVYSGSEYVWFVQSLLPGWATETFLRVRRPYLHLPIERVRAISWAIFAALYVEVGQP